MRSRLSKWKVKTLSIGGRLTLLKSVLGATSLYQMSIFKAPKGVLKEMEAIRSKFFNGGEPSDRKITWVAWEKVLTDKKHGGLGVSSLFALNRALLIKWIWRFISSDGSLWFKVIKAIYGPRLELHSISHSSLWCSIIKEMNVLKEKGFDFISHCQKRLGDGYSTCFWNDIWIHGISLKYRFPRLFALELEKDVSVAEKLGSSSVGASFRRGIRDGTERSQMDDLLACIQNVRLSQSSDRWICDLSGDGDFRVKEVRNYLDSLFLPSLPSPTRWIKYIPIKVNVFIWRARLNCIPTRYNLSRRGVSLASELCPLCDHTAETTAHVIFQCSLAREVNRRICRWWELDGCDVDSFSEWQDWFISIRLPAKTKILLEGVFCVSWWYIWLFRNRTLFDDAPPRRSLIFDDIVSFSYHWCSNRCNKDITWECWLKNPQFIFL